MADESHRNPAPAPIGTSVPSAPRSGVLDANGFDPTEFEWRPVPRRPRRDGWTPEAQQRFIGALTRTGVVERACEEVGLSVRSAYDLRNAPGGEGFARAWAHALTRAADRLLDIAFEQGIVGEEVPVYDQDGVRTGVKWKYNTRMAMFLLKAYHPERFGHVDRPVRRIGEPRPPAARSLADDVASLAPVTPAQPHLLGEPGRVRVMVCFARQDGAELAANPPDEREPWRPRPMPEQDDRVHRRAQRNRARRQHRAECENARLGLDSDVEHHGPTLAPYGRQDDHGEDLP